MLYITIITLLVPIAIGITSCNCDSVPDEHLAATDSAEASLIEPYIRQYTDEELEFFLDSIAALSPEQWMDDVAFMPDSIFKNREPMNKVLSDLDFSQLQEAVEMSQMDTVAARHIFGNFQMPDNYLGEETIPMSFYFFETDDTSFTEFAVCPGGSMSDWECDLYFFNSNRIISKQHVYHRYGLELEHYKDADGKTTVYYKENYVSGSGVWWYNYYFYKYDGNKIVPILNELQNSNSNFPWGRRMFWLESSIEKTNPLTIKMVYNVQFWTETEHVEIIRDSTVVVYNWDEKSRMLVGDYSKSKLSKAQILTYYVSTDEFLFINTRSGILKACLLDPTKREAALDYLDNVKSVRTLLMEMSP